MYRPICIVGLLLFASPAFGQDVLLIHGRVLKEDLTPFVQPVNLSVIAKRAGDPNPIRAALLDGSRYELRIPADRARDGSIWTIEFSEDSSHPGSVADISGPASGQSAPNAFVHQVDKVLLPGDGPEGYERNIGQLLEYERIWYDRVAGGVPVSALKQQFQGRLLTMPTIQDAKNIPEIFGSTRAARIKRDLLWRKRYEVFQLYGVALPELPACCCGCR